MMRDLTFNEVQEVNGGEFTPAEAATVEFALAGAALTVGAPLIALLAIGYAAILLSWD